MSKKDILSVRERDFPEPRGAAPSERALRSIERRRKAQKRYRQSEVGKAVRERRQAVKKVETIFLREYIRNNPEQVEKLRQKHFTKRIDGLGGTGA